MIQFFETIGKAVQAIFQSLVFCFQNIGFVIDSVVTALDIVPLFAALPTFVSGLSIITLVVAVVMLILRILHG